MTGFIEGEERSQSVLFRECEGLGIAVLVPKPLTSNNPARGLFDKRDFVYDAKRDEFRCPAGKRAVYRYSSEEDGLHARRTCVSR